MIDCLVIFQSLPDFVAGLLACLTLLLIIVATGFAQFEALRASVLSPLLPSALRRALPQYSNEVVGVMHAEATAGTGTLVDVTRVARDVYSNHLLPAEAFTAAAVTYFTLTYSMVGAFKLLEKRFLRHLQTERWPGATACSLDLSPQPARLG